MRAPVALCFGGGSSAARRLRSLEFPPRFVCCSCTYHAFVMRAQEVSKPSIACKSVVVVQCSARTPPPLPPVQAPSLRRRRRQWCAPAWGAGLAHGSGALGFLGPWGAAEVCADAARARARVRIRCACRRRLADVRHRSAGRGAPVAMGVGGAPTVHHVARWDPLGLCLGHCVVVLLRVHAPTPTPTPPTSDIFNALVADGRHSNERSWPFFARRNVPRAAQFVMTTTPCARPAGRRGRVQCWVGCTSLPSCCIAARARHADVLDARLEKPPPGPRRVRPNC